MATFKKGQRVRVTFPGHTYTTYDQWAKKNRMKGFTPNFMPEAGAIGTIVAVGPHNAGYDRTLVGVRIGKKSCIMWEQGVELASAKEHEVDDTLEVFSMTVRELSAAIDKIDKALDQIEASGLKRSAIVALLKDTTGMFKGDIEKVLDGMKALKGRYTTK